MSKNISAPMLALLAQQYQTLCTCWKVTWVDGTVHRFTDHDQDIVVAGWLTPNDIFNGTYLAPSGYTASDLASASDLNVDNLQLKGLLVNDSITEADLAAGKWDYAACSVFLVNWANLTNAMGPIRERDGWLGQVSLGERGIWQADVDGMMKKYQTVIGQIDSPVCNAILGDSRCLQDLTTFTKTGTLTGVSADGLTLYDPARTEPGPTGGVAITGITQANPGVVTLASPPVPAFTDLQLITISGVTGMTPVNAVTVVHSPSGTTFSLGVDTSAFPAYVSGGTATPFGTSGYFEFGQITIDSGANAGLSMEIKSYVPGQFTLFMPFPYALTGTESYTAVAGCDKSLVTCRDKFANLVHRRATGDFLPGLDKIVQVGRQQ